MSSTKSVLLYGPEEWAEALGKVAVTSAYRTVFKPAVMMIAGVIPVALLAKERQAIYKYKGDEPREIVAREEQQRTIDER